MKKSLLYTSIATLTLLASCGITLAIGNVNATEITNNTTPTSTNEVATPIPLNNLDSKDENIFIITDDNGSANKIFTGSTLATTTKPLPINLSITYTLDGTTISAANLAGKSGHVKMSYTYTATSTHHNKLVPFLVVTGLQLDSSKFSNIKLNNGKIISEKDNYTIAGYSLAGLNSDLNTNLLPDTFTIEADVNDFELDNVYAFATNEVFTNLDTSKLNTVDGLINSISQLDSGINQILDGATRLDSGLGSLVAGIHKLQSGVSELNSGATQLASGASTISTNTSKLVAGAERLSNGLDSLVAIDDQVLSYVNPTAAKIDSGITTLRQKITELSEANPELAEQLSQTLSEVNNYYTQVYGAIIGYTNSVKGLAGGASQLTDGLSNLATGTAQLASGAHALSSGITELESGTDQLASGATQLQSGSKTLSSGIATFKTEGIDRLTDFASHDLANFTANARATIDAAKSYHSYQSPTATSVKFIFKTPSIK